TEDGLRRREEGKREDGNLAFKCNWNDKGYRGVCSEQAYQYNKQWGRPWCWSAECRKYVGIDPVPVECCYESRALTDCSFAAGWDLDGNNMSKARRILSAREGKIALLTTEPPGLHERVLVGAYIIKDVVDDPGKETWVYGDKGSVLDDMLKFKIPFWKYHKNPINPQSTAWATGLFRYVSDVAVLGILEEYISKKSRVGGNTANAGIMLAALRQQGQHG
ncbi:MAG: hypothetical protein PHQ43_05930, partial [Dehalococcoidales bacterium]|nr:hypothetical protein [Dehalococcoidales bacterium]